MNVRIYRQNDGRYIRTGNEEKGGPGCYVSGRFYLEKKNDFGA